MSMNVDVTQAHIDAATPENNPLQIAVREQRDADKFHSSGQATIDIDPAGRVDMNGLPFFQLPAAAITFKDAFDLGGAGSVITFSFVLPEIS